MASDQNQTTPAQRSIRMRTADRDDTLDGYVFGDFTHARQWLLQPFVGRARIKLEEVTVGPRCACRHCDGSGYQQDIKAVRKMTVAEFLAEAISDGAT